METRGGRTAKTILMTGRKKPPNCHCPYILVSNLVSSNVRFLFMCPLSTLFLPFSATHLGGRCYHVRHPFRLRRTCRAGRWPSVFGTRGIKVRQRSASLSSYSPALLPLGSVGYGHGTETLLKSVPNGWVVPKNRASKHGSSYTYSCKKKPNGKQFNSTRALG